MYAAVKTFFSVICARPRCRVSDEEVGAREGNLHAGNAGAKRPSKVLSKSRRESQINFRPRQRALPKRTSIKEPALIFLLPNELFIYLLRFLNYGDIERLRLTTPRFYYMFKRTDILMSYGSAYLFNLDIKMTCEICLETHPDDSGSIVRYKDRSRYRGLGEATVCIPCASRKRLLDVDTFYWPPMASGDARRPCRWCGMPVTPPCIADEIFHVECWYQYFKFWCSMLLLCLPYVAISLIFIVMLYNWYPGIPYAKLMLTMLLVFTIASSPVPLYFGGRYIGHIWQVTMNILLLLFWGIWMTVLSGMEELWADFISQPLHGLIVLLALRVLATIGSLLIDFKYKFWLYKSEYDRPWEKGLHWILWIIILFSCPASLFVRYHKVDYVPREALRQAH